jgi:predicted Zn finger-like uncharacterized protein
MIIVCPDCKTKYNVPSKAVPDNGRKVKCKNCQHEWIQYPLDALEDDARPIPPITEIEEIPERSNLPSEKVLPPVPVPVEFKIAFFTFVLLALCLHFITYQRAIIDKYPFTQGIYRTIGLSYTRNLVLTGLDAGSRRDGNFLNVFFKAKLLNESFEGKRDPQDVHISMLSKKGNVMGEVAFRMPDALVEPEQALPVESRIAKVSGNTKMVVLDVGNPIERMFRPKINYFKSAH